ncbi:hypothetical protein [Halomicrococcus sp. NG-SE-24]|uniref:hypothetical protein n=1 Tax=Halomicrococcus sp. NG-SE-24 TaxID=3436928 RepID=UPI003D95476A
MVPIAVSEAPARLPSGPRMTGHAYWYVPAAPTATTTTATNVHREERRWSRSMGTAGYYSIGENIRLGTVRTMLGRFNPRWRWKRD